MKKRSELGVSLSKSRYLSGMQCEKALYLSVHNPELKNQFNPTVEQRKQAGNQVGIAARNLFPGGVDVSSTANRNKSDWIDRTQRAIAAGESIIYEAAFMADEVFVAVDILTVSKKGVAAYEVKSSSSLKSHHLLDAGVQAWVIARCNYTITSFNIIHLNSNYVRRGKLDYHALFEIRPITEELPPYQKTIAQNLTRFQHLLEREHAPEIPIGKHCNTPRPCRFKHHCWQDIPEDSVFDLSNDHEKGWELFNSGTKKLADIPSTTPLTPAQAMQVNGAKTGAEIWKKTAISSFLKTCSFPRYYFDFETVMPSIPPFNNTQPNRNIPFQYSLHIQHVPQGPLTHVEFLAEKDTGDFRLALANQLASDLGTTGAIIVYNATFERQQLNQLADLFPQHAPQFHNAVKRLVDLMRPFQKHWVYVPAMKGRHSIKTVLPALVPGFSYNELAIQQGGDANALFAQYLDGTYRGDSAELRADLLAYCKLDTLAMFKIMEVLETKTNQTTHS